MKSGQNGLGFQNFYNIPQGVEVPLLTYQWFSNLIQCHRYGNCGTELVADDRYNLGKRTVEDYETTSYAVKTDFMRKWHQMMENEDGNMFEVADPQGEF